MIYIDELFADWYAGHHYRYIYIYIRLSHAPIYGMRLMPQYD